GCVINGTLRNSSVVAAGDNKLDCKSAFLAGIICGPTGDRKRCHGAKSSRSERRKHRMTTGESGSRNRKIEADMELRFQPALLQEVIDSFVEKTEREGDPTYYKEFHELADPIYEKFTLDDWESEFKKLYQYLFGTWGFSDIIRDAFNEYPLVKEKIGIVLVKGVLKEDQEGVDILRKWGSVEQDLA